jgi:hypothetical protein
MRLLLGLTAILMAFGSGGMACVYVKYQNPMMLGLSVAWGLLVIVICTASICNAIRGDEDDQVVHVSSSLPAHPESAATS